MKKFMMFTFFIALVGVLFLAPDAMAQSTGGGAKVAGESLVNTLSSVVAGNIGLFAGIALALFGLYTWLVAQNTGTGIIMIIGGVIVTAFPGIFEGLSEGVNPILEAFVGDGTEINERNTDLTIQ